MLTACLTKTRYQYMLIMFDKESDKIKFVNRHFMINRLIDICCLKYYKTLLSSLKQ